MKKILFNVLVLLSATFLVFNVSAQFNEAQLFSDVKTLASDEYGGRKTGTKGNEMAEEYLIKRFKEIGLSPAGEKGFRHPFSFYNQANKLEGNNISGLIKGSQQPGTYLVIGAHYDHIGTNKKGQVFNGADDNASGVGALLAVAQHFSENPPLHSVLFLAFDAEEMGLIGSRKFTENPTIPLKNVKAMINMDMVSINAQNEIYACGTKYYPVLKPVLGKVAEKHSALTLSFGHDSPVPTRSDDWSKASDHRHFHERGIPFVYFGVEDHTHYHRPTDTFDNINQPFYTNVVRMIIDAAAAFDEQLGTFSE